MRKKEVPHCRDGNMSCRYVSRDMFWHSRGVSVPRAVIRISQGAACECLGSEEAKKHVRSIPSFLLLCSKTAFSIFRCNSTDFYKKNPNTGSSRFKTGNKFWDAERDIMLVSAFVCLFFLSTRYLLQARKMKHSCNVYFLKGAGEVFQRRPVDSSRGIPEHFGQMRASRPGALSGLK